MTGQRYLYDVAKTELADGTYVLDVLPTLGDWMTPLLRDGVMRHRLMITTGECPCGAKPTVSRGQLDTTHAPDCAVPAPPVQRLINALTARAYAELPGVIR